MVYSDFGTCLVDGAVSIKDILLDIRIRIIEWIKKVTIYDSCTFNR